MKIDKIGSLSCFKSFCLLCKILQKGNCSYLIHVLMGPCKSVRQVQFCSQCYLNSPRVRPDHSTIMRVDIAEAEYGLALSTGLQAVPWHFLLAEPSSLIPGL